MKILIDILHPAHVHVFRNFAADMRARGHQIAITARKKECSIDLLERYGLEHTWISSQRSGGLGLAREMVERTARLMRIMREFRPDVMTGIMGPSIAVAGKLLRVPAVIFYDTEFATQTNWFAYPLAHSVCTPDCYQGRVRGHHITYPGYHELAYLHPRRFTPDPSRLSQFGIHDGEPYSILRFVAWQAIHDRREKGLTGEEQRRLLALLSSRGRVLISAEGKLPPDLEELRLRGPVDEIHHVLAHAQMLVGESATMASEAAVLGTPAVFIATTGRGYTDDQQSRYGHVRYFKEAEFDQAVAAITEMFDRGPRALGARAREKLLGEKIDVTQWMVNYFEREFGGAPGSDERPARAGSVED